MVVIGETLSRKHWSSTIFTGRTKEVTIEISSSRRDKEGKRNYSVFTRHQEDLEKIDSVVHQKRAEPQDEGAAGDNRNNQHYFGSLVKRYTRHQ